MKICFSLLLNNSRFGEVYTFACRWWVGAGATWPRGVKRVVGWHLTMQMPTELVLTALEQTLTLRQSAPGLIIYADRGSQYTSQTCRQRIEATGTSAQATPRPKRTGALRKPSCCPVAARLSAWKSPAYYLDTYFNVDRRHSALCYHSPHPFEADLLNHIP